MPGKKMPPKKGAGLMVMIGLGKPKAKGKMNGGEAPMMPKKAMKKPSAKKPGGIKTMPKGKPGSGSQGRNY